MTGERFAADALEQAEEEAWLARWSSALRASGSDDFEWRGNASGQQPYYRGNPTYWYCCRRCGYQRQLGVDGAGGDAIVHRCAGGRLGHAFACAPWSAVELGARALAGIPCEHAWSAHDPDCLLCGKNAEEHHTELLRDRRDAEDVIEQTLGKALEQIGSTIQQLRALRTGKPLEPFGTVGPVAMHIFRREAPGMAERLLREIRSWEVRQREKEKERRERG